MARRLIAKPKTISEACALVGKRLRITTWGTGASVRMHPALHMPLAASWHLEVEGDVTGYHVVQGIHPAMEITLAGYGGMDIADPWTYVYRVLPPWWQRALIWLGLMARPHWY